MKYIKKSFVIGLIAVSGVALGHSGATGIVKERMDKFKDAKASIKVLKSAIKKKDFATVTKEAESINLWAKELIASFPIGSNPHPSEALDRIWQEFDQFENEAKAQIRASEKLMKAAIAQDSKASTAAFKELANTCKSCHNSYRE